MLTVKVACKICITLQCKTQDLNAEKPNYFTLNIMLMRNHGKKIELATTDRLHASSGDYRTGFVVLTLNRLPPNKYTLIVSTFNPQEFGNYLLSIKYKAIDPKFNQHPYDAPIVLLRDL